MRPPALEGKRHDLTTLTQRASPTSVIEDDRLPLLSMRKLLLLLFVVALTVIVAWIWLANRPSEIERAVLSTAEAGEFPLTTGYSYNGQIECRVEDIEAFHGEDLFICRLGLNGVDAGGKYVYAALVDGVLHTHQTDPAEIPARAFDPGF
jgi:hypothetical protein